MFSADVFHNEYLSEGVDVVDAIVTVRSDPNLKQSASSDSIEVIVIDTSGSMQEDNGAKIVAAREATKAAIDTIDDGVKFAIIGGSAGAYMIYPKDQGLVVSTRQTREMAKSSVSRVYPSGGTAIGTWLTAVTYLTQPHPNSIAHCLLLTDGKNQHETSHELDQAIANAVGLFQCDARGLGVDWDVDELRRVSSALLGTVDIIPRPEDMADEFTRLTEAAMGKQVGNVALRLWTPKGSTCEFIKQVAPNLEDLTANGSSVGPLMRDYPLGSWAADEERDYHLRIRMPAGSVGEERLAARVILSIDGAEEPVALVRAIWTDDEALSTRLSPEVAHYTGQAELAAAIADGLAARDAGDEATATVKLGRAVQLAHDAGNDDTVKLLNKIVEVDDAATGTVRLRREVDEVDRMKLDVRSTRTVRVRKS